MQRDLQLFITEDVCLSALPRAPDSGASGHAIAEILAASKLFVTVGVVSASSTKAILQWLHVAPRTADAFVMSILPDLLDATVTPETAEHNLVAIAEELRNRSSAHLFVINASSYDPQDTSYTLAGLDHEPISLRTHRFNIAVIRAAQTSGLFVIDVDGLSAEAGAAKHVLSAHDYSADLRRLVLHELTHQLRSSLSAYASQGVYALTVPRYDRRVVNVEITKWHKQPGERISYGEAILELRADNILWRLVDEETEIPRPTGRSLVLIVNAGASGVLREMSIRPGSAVRVGETIGLITESQDVAVPTASLLDQLPRFPATASPLVWRSE
jgi:hypothetical protein